MAQWFDRIRSAWRALRKGSGPTRYFQVVTPRWQSGRPASWTDDPAEQVKHYKHWVYAAVQAIAFKVASTQLRLFRGDGAQVREVAAHPFLDLMREVNPFHTRFWLWAQTMAFLELTGNAYWYVPSNGLGAPAEVWVVHSQHVRVIPDRRAFVGGYEFRNGGDRIRFGRDEIIHLKYPNPLSVHYGRGPLQAAAESVDTHEWLKKSEWSSLKQGIYPSLSLESDQELTDAAIERLRTQLTQKYASPEKAGRPLILEKGLKARPVSLSPREMDFIRSARLTRDEILGIFRVPASVAGLSEDVNRSVAQAMDVTFAKYCITPKLRMIEDQLNQDLLPRFDPRLFCRFDSVVPQNREQDRADMEARLRHKVTTVNEERRALGREPVPWGEAPAEPD